MDEKKTTAQAFYILLQYLLHFIKLSPKHTSKKAIQTHVGYLCRIPPEANLETNVIQNSSNTSGSNRETDQQLQESGLGSNFFKSLDFAPTDYSQNRSDKGHKQRSCATWNKIE